MMAHEDLSRERDVESSSNRSFGLVFTLGFVFVAALPLLHGRGLRWWAVAVAALIGLAAVLKPEILAPLNRWWTRLEVMLGKLVSPVALGVLFYGVFTPMGALMRLLGSDSLKLKFESGAQSYWVVRDPPGPPPDSMTNQF